MPTAPSEALRDAVLTGRYFSDAPAASGVAEMLTSRDAGLQLRFWFGDGWLTMLAAEKDHIAFLRVALDRDIAAMDMMISEQLDAILHHARLRRLEGTWRGLWWLVNRMPPTSGRTRIKLLQARWAEVCRDIERASEFDQSALFRKIYEEQFGTAGGEPFGLIAADYEVQHRPTPDHPTDDVGVLSGLASVAAAAFSPIVLGAAPALLGLDSFADLSASSDFSTFLQGAEHRRWRNAANQDDFRFLGIALPRVLARPPWSDDGSRADHFRYRTHAPGATERVWTSPVYGLAAAAVRAFERYSWPAEMRGADISDEARGGVLEDLAYERFPSDPRHDSPARSPLELALTDEQESQIGEAGLIPLAALEGLPEACLGSLPSLHRPPRMTTAVADANQRLSSQLNSVLCVSRFAHCVKMMGRDMVGSYADPSEVEARLQRWLNGFISGLGSGGPEVTAKYPLLDARVDVREQRGRPGVYGCTIHLKPHHQLDEIGAAFRFVTEFAPHRVAS